MDLSQKILSDITHHMKYAKFLPNQFRRETFEETVNRNIDMHVKKFPHLEDEIRNAYKFVFDRKVLPSMRSMQFAGEAIEKNNARIFNCSFVPMDHQRAFSEIMFLLLSGCGVGFSVQTHHIEKLPEIRKPNEKRTIKFLIGDSVEGWADSIKAMIKSYFEGTSKIRFDYSDIRPKGARLVTAGGKAPGPQPLKECLIKIEGILEQKENGDKLSSLEVHDIVCVIADAVLAGGIRRSALISFFDADDQEMISCKSGSWWETHPYRGRANNSAVLMRSKISESFFMNLWEKIQMSGSGEPGVVLSNDKDVLGNPCMEIALRSNQMCNLVEINASDILDQEDYNNRVRSASFIATLQASYTDFHYLRDIWKRTTEKEALIGVSMTGIASNKVFNLNIKEAAEIVKQENERVADLIKINKAARTTTCKPAGTTSLIFGTSSGIHAWHDNFYIRRVRVGKNEPIYAYLKQNHPALIEDEYFRPHDTAVICVPQKAPDNSTLRNEETSIELLERIKQVHADWIKPGHRKGANTNNVSATISVKPDEWDVVGKWMWENRDSYTGLSVLPFSDHTYVQAPFETCTEEEYNRLFQSLQNVDLSQIFESEDETDLQGEVACGNSGCEVK